LQLDKSNNYVMRKPLEKRRGSAEKAAIGLANGQIVTSKRPRSQDELDESDAAESRRRLADAADGTISLEKLREELGI
jgi:hypothetical protein